MDEHLERDRLTNLLHTFEPVAWRCRSVYAERVRAHLSGRLRALGVDEPSTAPPADDTAEAGVDALDDLYAPDEVEDLDSLDEGLDALFPERTPTGDRALLVVHEGTPDELILPLQRGALRLGRGTGSGLRLEDTRVSRNHCEISWSEGSWFIVDPGSANGTLVNGEMLAPGIARRLYGGEELIVGNTFVRFLTTPPRSGSAG